MSTPVQCMASFLATVREIVTARGANYGTPAENHGRTAAMWSAYLGRTITADDVCVLNVLQKLSRQANKPDPDNWLDVAGYAANAGACVSLATDPALEVAPESPGFLPFEGPKDSMAELYAALPKVPAPPGPHRYEVQTPLPPMGPAFDAQGPT